MDQMDASRSRKHVHTKAGMIDISPPNLAPKTGTIAMLQAAAPVAVKKTIEDRKTFLRHKTETKVAQITDGSRKYKNDDFSCWSMLRPTYG